MLYEMATSSTPVYGDGMSDPRVLNDDVTVTAEDFTAAGLSRSRAEALVAFFRTALTRNAKDRFDTAAAMRAAWASAFQVKAAGEHPSAPAPIDPIAKPAAPQPVARTYDSLDTLATEFAKAAGNKPSVMRRQVVELVLGTHERSPADPFITYPALAALAGGSHLVALHRSSESFLISGRRMTDWQLPPPTSTGADSPCSRHQAVLRHPNSWHANSQDP